MSKPISILLADDHELIGKMLSSLLESENDMQVVCSLSNSEDAIQEAIQLAPDVCALHIDMPGRSCFDAARSETRHSTLSSAHRACSASPNFRTVSKSRARISARDGSSDRIRPS